MQRLEEVVGRLLEQTPGRQDREVNVGINTYAANLIKHTS